MHHHMNGCPCHRAMDANNTPPPHAGVTPGAHTMPLIGDRAPEFTAQTTNGQINFPIDYAGKWVVFFSHPADFTPVCTTEFMAFQSRMAEFERMNVTLVGMSVGTLTGHLAWLDAIRGIKWNGMTDTAITFPVIDDMNMEISRKYGMIHNGANNSKTVRAVFLIDPNAVVRAIFYYPATTGRNVDEIIRTLRALQVTDKYDVSTPVNWMPGDDVVVSAPGTMAEITKERMGQDKSIDWHAWFLGTKKLPGDAK